jgi:hypothetical protein
MYLVFSVLIFHHFYILLIFSDFFQWLLLVLFKLHNILLPCFVAFINKLPKVLRFYCNRLYSRCFVNIMWDLFPFTIFVKKFAFIFPVFIWLFHLLCSKPDPVIGLLAFVEAEC